MVFAVQCPNPKCRKFMLVEDRDRNNLVSCLLCKASIKVGGGPAGTRKKTTEHTEHTEKKRKA